MARSWRPRHSDFGATYDVDNPEPAQAEAALHAVQLGRYNARRTVMNTDDQDGGAQAPAYETLTASARRRERRLRGAASEDSTDGTSSVARSARAGIDVRRHATIRRAGSTAFRMAQHKFHGNEAQYVQLADEVDRRIRAGEFGPRDRLPSESALMEQYGLSRVTVRQAMAILEKRGRLVRRRGLGTFVAGPKIHHDLAELAGFYDSLVAQGLSPDVSLLDFRAVVPNQKVALKLGKSSATLVLRLYRLHGVPFAITYVHTLNELQRLTRDTVAANPTYHILESILHYHIDHAELTIRAESAGEGPGRQLEVGAQAPVLVLERTSYADSGEALEHTQCYLRSDTYEFGLTVRGQFSLVGGFRAAPRFVAESQSP